MSQNQTDPQRLNLTPIKTKQQATWSSGDYAVIGSTLQIVGEQLAEALDLRSGQQVLDVAAGNGNFTLAAARRWCEVTSSDYAPTLLARGQQRAKAEGFQPSFQIADAEALPFADASFDTVGSTFGVMFTPDQNQAAREMLRVCRGGGKIGLANWTPEGFIGALFRTVGAHVPPPNGVPSPALWGVDTHLQELFGSGAREIETLPRKFLFRDRSPAQWLDRFRELYGPVRNAFAALDETGQKALERDLLELADRFNVAKDGTLIAPGEYLEVVITRT